jgi:hypothetical protein
MIIQGHKVGHFLETCMRDNGQVSMAILTGARAVHSAKLRKKQKGMWRPGAVACSAEVARARGSKPWE